MNNNRTLLIGDSGSTKTSWRIVHADGKISQHRTEGFNPYYHTAETLKESMVAALEPLKELQPDEVHFYGSGCSTDSATAKVATAINAVYPNSDINVEHDLLAAARALCANEKGIACILGTGSNSCLYDGREIIDNIPNLGLWLGDEGSGGYIGRELVAAFLRKEMPEHLSAKFLKRYGLTREDALDHIYQQEYPNRWLAKFSKFAFDNLKESYIFELVYSAIDLFFKRNICRYEGHGQLKVHFVGSVAFYYQKVVREVAKSHGISIGRILEDPIAGLTLYHKEQQQ